MMDPSLIWEFQQAVDKYFPGERPDAVLKDVKELRELLRAIKREHGSIAIFMAKIKSVLAVAGLAGRAGV